MKCCWDDICFDIHRFYDPRAKRFLTPDSYFFENPDKLVESPVEGNLYSYAGNNPVSFLDPKGENKVLTAIIVVATVWKIMDVLTEDSDKKSLQEQVLDANSLRQPNPVTPENIVNKAFIETEKNQNYNNVEGKTDEQFRQESMSELNSEIDTLGNVDSYGSSSVDGDSGVESVDESTTSALGFE